MTLLNVVRLHCRNRSVLLSSTVWSSFAYLRIVLRNEELSDEEALSASVHLPDDMLILLRFLSGELTPELSYALNYDDCLTLREHATVLGLDTDSITAGQLASVLHTVASAHSWTLHAWESLCVLCNRNFDSQWPTFLLSQNGAVDRHAKMRELFVRSVLPLTGPAVDLRCAEALSDKEDALRLRQARGIEPLLRDLGFRPEAREIE